MKPLSPKTLERKYAELGLSKAKIDLLRNYFLCFANLYGMLEVREAWDVFKHYEGNKIRKKDFIAFSGIVQREPDLPFSVLELNEVFTDEPAGKPDMRLIVNNFGFLTVKMNCSSFISTVSIFQRKVRKWQNF